MESVTLADMALEHINQRENQLEGKELRPQGRWTHGAVNSTEGNWQGQVRGRWPAAIQSICKAQHAACFPRPAPGHSHPPWMDRQVSVNLGPQAPSPSTVRVYNDGVVFCLDTPPFNYLINHFPNPRPLINCKGSLQLSSKITHIGAVTGIFLCLGRPILSRYTKPLSLGR